MMYDLSLGNSLFVDNELDCAIQELDILFGTENTELIGYPYFGTFFEQFLWQLNPSVETLKTYIMDKIADETYFLSKFKVNIEVAIIDGELRNIYNVLISVEDPSTKNKQQKLYQFR